MTIRLQFFLMILLTLPFGACSDSNDDSNNFALCIKTDIRENISISRNLETKNAKIETRGLTNWKIYIGNTIEEIDYLNPILEGNHSGTFDVELSNRHYYFHLISNEGNALIAPRLLPMKNVYNFRDLGGYKTKDGLYTKWGKIFRSGEINKLSEDDLNYLSSIPLTTIVDFRTEDEIESAEDLKPISLKNHYVMSILAGNLSILQEMASKNEEEIEQMSIDLNIDLVTNPVALRSFKEYFKILQSDNANPLLFHCTAGKDRTGIAAALTLYALGVDESTIIKDYKESNEHLKNKYAAQIANYRPVIAFFQVREIYMTSAFDKIKADYGSIENFLTNEMEVDIQKLKSIYLY